MILIARMQHSASQYLLGRIACCPAELRSEDYTFGKADDIFLYPEAVWGLCIYGSASRGILLDTLAIDLIENVALQPAIAGTPGQVCDFETSSTAG